MLCSYLPLLREFIPDAAAEIELDMDAQSSKQGYQLIEIVSSNVSAI